jgi:hypothetical protein
LIEVEGTRMKISKKLFRHAEKERERKNILRLFHFNHIFKINFIFIIFRLHIPRKILETGKKHGKKPKTVPKISTVTIEHTKEEAALSSSSTLKTATSNEEILTAAAAAGDRDLLVKRNIYQLILIRPFNHQTTCPYN